MFVIQNELRPGAIQNALNDLMRNGITSVRVCSAYISMCGSEILFDGICRSAPGGNHDQVRKTIVTSLDYGLTEPEALQFWTNAQHCNVLVAGVSQLEQGNLVPPYTAFHPKLYIFEMPGGMVSQPVVYES